MRLKFQGNEKDKIKEKLLKVYEKLGKIKEYKILKDIGRV